MKPNELESAIEKSHDGEWLSAIKRAEAAEARVRELEAMIADVRNEAEAALLSHRVGGQHCGPANSLPVSAAKMLLRITGGAR